MRARSTARVMKLKAGAQSTIHFRAEGSQADDALSALVDFVRRDFDEGPAAASGSDAAAGLADAPRDDATDSGAAEDDPPENQVGAAIHAGSKTGLADAPRDDATDSGAATDDSSDNQVGAATRARSKTGLADAPRDDATDSGAAPDDSPETQVGATIRARSKTGLASTAERTTRERAAAGMVRGRSDPRARTTQGPETRRLRGGNARRPDRCRRGDVAGRAGNFGSGRVSGACDRRPAHACTVQWRDSAGWRLERRTRRFR